MKNNNIIQPQAVIVDARTVVEELIHCLKMATIYFPESLPDEHNTHLQRRKNRIAKAIKAGEELIS